MVEFKREKEVIEIKISTSIGWSITTEFKAPSEMYSILLKQSIDEKLGDTLERIRREAYEQGWDDHKKRRPKADWFKRWW